MDAALALLRLQGIRVLHYIEDWLILSQSQKRVVRHRDVVLDRIKCLGGAPGRVCFHHFVEQPF